MGPCCALAAENSRSIGIRDSSGTFRGQCSSDWTIGTLTDGERESRNPSGLRYVCVEADTSFYFQGGVFFLIAAMMVPVQSSILSVGLF
jgi:hypothetical protein